MNLVLILLGLLCAIQSCRSQVFRLSRIFQNNMVLQQGPKRARLWGYGEIGAIVSVSLGEYSDSMNIGGSAQWSFVLPPQPAGGPHNISIVQSNTQKGTRATEELQNIIFGDVWLCAGEGNMQFPMRNIFNSTYEMETAMQYSGKIRTAWLEPDTWDTALDEPRLEYRQTWSEIKPGNIPEFSAICLLYAERLIDQVLNHPPIGLIQVTYEDSNIEAWISERVFDVCNSTQSPEYGEGLVKDHTIWNAMINPLTKTSIMGAIWNQGESNVNHNNGWYTCHFRNLTFDWAYTFFDGTVQTQEEGWAFPFGIVQLGPMNGESDELVSLLRLHQTYDTEFAPNYYNNETFMAPAYDLFDPTSPFGSVYYRDKQTVAKRLAHSILFLMHDRFDLEFVGPIPSIEVRDLTFCTVTYSWEVKFNGEAGDPSGFYFRRRNLVWVEAPIYNITLDTMTFIIEDNAVEISYGWAAKQCEYKSCPVYSNDRGPDGFPAVIMSFPLYVFP